jgi:hypothetical protein
MTKKWNNFSGLEIFYQSQLLGDRSMRKLIFTCIAAALVTAPMASIVKAEDTTVIKRDRDGEGGSKCCFGAARRGEDHHKERARLVSSSRDLH